VSIPVDRVALGAQIEKAGALALLVTVGDDRTPHVVSVRPALESGALRLPAGRTTRANVATSSTVTLVWPGDAAAEYALIVDGDADATGDDEITVSPRSAVLHRKATAPGDGPSCIRLDAS
jgi:hypothetical protein